MLPIRFPVELFQQLRARAIAEGISIPKLVIKLIESALTAGY